MKTDIVLRSEGMRILAQNLGIVDCERFITIILREPFDYTKWRQDLFADETLDDFLDNAMKYRKKSQRKQRKI
ncbi:MAG: hypothetical protein FWF51_09350 [Chitinivibrionia bacterium]|nr:hypothetical protein [Chitinivibrionia bacterium]MCL1947334.1 hypothetical protein [Chitinivibrionia bacterium]